MTGSMDHLPAPNTASATLVNCSSMWVWSSAGGSAPCILHTTMGTPHTSQSATQHTSSS